MSYRRFQRSNTTRNSPYRSGFEKRFAEHLESQGIPVVYEKSVIKYEKPVRPSRYTPDFQLPNGIFIEVKGLFSAADRAKHVLIKQQHPELDIRFLFQRADSKLYKGSKTTYATWCNQNGFRWAQGALPKSWLTE